MSRRSVRLKAKMEERSSPRPKSPKHCSICLEETENKCFTDECSHEFCFVCLQEWSKVKPECPLCKRKFRKIMYNIRSYSDCDEYNVPVIDRSDNLEPPFATSNFIPNFVDLFHHRHSRQLTRENIIPPIFNPPISRLQDPFVNGSFRYKRNNSSHRWRSNESYRDNSSSSRELREWIRHELLKSFSNGGHYGSSSYSSNFEELVSQVIDAVNRNPLDSAQLRNILHCHMGNLTDEFITKLKYRSPLSRGHSSRNYLSSLNTGDDDVVVINDSSMSVSSESSIRRRKRSLPKRTSRAVNLSTFTADSSSDNDISPSFPRSMRTNRTSSSSIECIGSSDENGIIEERTTTAIFQGRSRPKRRTMHTNRVLSRAPANSPSRWLTRCPIGIRRSSPVISLCSTSLGDVEPADDEIQIISSTAPVVECINLADETSFVTDHHPDESNDIIIGYERRKRKRAPSFRRKDSNIKKFNPKGPSSSSNKDSETIEIESWLSAVERVDRTSRQNSRKNSAEDVRNQDDSSSEIRNEPPAKRKKGTLRKDSARLNRTVFNDDIDMMDWRGVDCDKRKKNETYFPFEKNIKIFADDTSDDDDENFVSFF